MFKNINNVNLGGKLNILRDKKIKINWFKIMPLKNVL